MPRDDGSGVRLAAHGVSVDFGRRRVLEEIDLALHGGEIVTLIGPNGSGKTTLVRTLLGLIAPALGRVERTPGLRFGYMPQALHLDRTLPLAVGRFLTLGAPRGHRAIAAALEEVGAGALAARQFHDLSGGEARRVLLARALLRDPDVLVLDEPTAQIDVTGQAEFYDLVRGLRDRRGCAVLLVSHDLHLVMAATDHVVCLNRHICCSGRPERVRADPAYLALFGRRVAETVALYTHAHDHTHALSGQPVPDHHHG
ncbi:MAG: ATP-binding cassette domain-containing protein [Alphaproteobacteria bacterium]|nr:ATP-binding cassette domain-containing protein [Alphaproteobacteria bacterium]